MWKLITTSVDKGICKVWIGIGYILELRQEEFGFECVVDNNSKGNDFSKKWT